MNVLISLDPEEIEALIDFHADKIGHVDEAACDRSMKRIEQLERAKPSKHYEHDFERAA